MSLPKSGIVLKVNFGELTIQEVYDLGELVKSSGRDLVEWEGRVMFQPRDQEGNPTPWNEVCILPDGERYRGQTVHTGEFTIMSVREFQEALRS